MKIDSKKLIFIYLAVVFFELTLFRIIAKLAIFLQGREAMNTFLLLLKGVPGIIAYLVTLLLGLIYLDDSNRIVEAMIRLKEKFPTLGIKEPLNGVFFLFCIPYIYLQYISLKENFYWGLYVQSTIFMLILGRRYSMTEKNIHAIILDYDKLGKYSPIALLKSMFRIKHLMIASLPVAGNFFLAIAIYIGKIQNVEYEWYDLPVLYLFFIFLALIFIAGLFVPAKNLFKK